MKFKVNQENFTVAKKINKFYDEAFKDLGFDPEPEKDKLEGSILENLAQEFLLLE